MGYLGECKGGVSSPSPWRTSPENCRAADNAGFIFSRPSLPCTHLLATSSFPSPCFLFFPSSLSPSSFS